MDPATGFLMVSLWWKYKPIIERYRGWQWPKSSYSDFEYLADVLEKRLGNEEPGYVKKVKEYFGGSRNTLR